MTTAKNFSQNLRSIFSTTKETNPVFGDLRLEGGGVRVRHQIGETEKTTFHVLGLGVWSSRKFTPFPK